MKREIKFRMWDHDCADPQMHYLEPVICDNGLWFQLDPNKGHNDSEDAIIMQYTGLHAAGDKEVYEGDVLMAKFRSPGGGGNHVQYMGVVTFRNGGFYLEGRKEWLGWAEPLGSTALWLHMAQILGNVYENPELLTQ